MEHMRECPAKDHSFHTCAEVRVAWEDWKTKYDSAFHSYKGQLEKVRLLELQIGELTEERDSLKKCLGEVWLGLDEFFGVIRGIIPDETLATWQEACRVMREYTEKTNPEKREGR